MSDYFTTGDGLTAGLQILSIIVETGKKASELFSIFDPFPQIINNIKIDRNLNLLKDKKIAKIINNLKEEINKEGRIIVRESGTEPLIRVMVEHKDKIKANKILSYLSSVIEEKNKI